MARWTVFRQLGLALFCTSGALWGCAETGIGDPCQVEVDSQGGYEDNDRIIEVGSIQCRTRVCMVFNEESFCSARCETDADCLAEWNEEGPGQGDQPPAYCEAEIRVGAPSVKGRYCVPAYASDHAVE